LLGDTSTEREKRAGAAVWWVWLRCLPTTQEAGDTWAWSQGPLCDELYAVVVVNECYNVLRPISIAAALHGVA